MDSNDRLIENNKAMSAPLFSPSASSSTIRSLPPGFRFRPTDEELIVHYLQQKVNSRPLPAYLIAEINLYMYNPWELPNKALFGEDEWYFFSPIYRKYPNGERPNRAAGSGYWKATGTDQSIVLSDGSDQMIGVKKALVFHKGRPPKGTKTDWMMSEYRIMDTSSSSSNPKPSMFKKSMRLDDWVLCRVRRRGNFNPLMGGEDHNYPSIVTPKSREENYYYPYTTQQASNMSDYMSMQHPSTDSQVMASLLIGEYRNQSPNQSPNTEAAPFSTITKNINNIINNYIDNDHNNNSGAPCDFQGFNQTNATGLMGRYVPEEDRNSSSTPVPVDSQVMASLLIGEYQNQSPNQSPNTEAAPFSTIPKNINNIINNYIDNDHNNNSGAPCDLQGFNQTNATGLMGRYVPEEDRNSPSTPVPVWERNNWLENIILEDYTCEDRLWDNEAESDDIVIDQRYHTMNDDHGNILSYDSTGLLLNI